MSAIVLSDKGTRFIFSKGRLAKHSRTGEYYIETPGSLWKTRLDIWKAAYKQHGKDCKVPCPAPWDHDIFREDFGEFRRVQK